MNASQSTQLSSQANTNASLPTIRELSTEQQNEWIERIFLRLTTIYGKEFSQKWVDVEPDDLKAEWAESLGGFHAVDIAAALQACRAQPKAPNLPEFASMCRQNMSTRTTVNIPPLTPEGRAVAAKVAESISKSMSAKEANTKGYMLNGVLVTVYRQWAVNLMKREANGESLPHVSKAGWRMALGFSPDYPAEEAIKAAA